MWPPDEELLAAWQRLVADPDTAGAFAELVLPPLEADLARRFVRQHPDDRTAAADTAVLTLLRNPTAFDPAKGPLPAFLRLIAGRDVLNLIDREKRHRRGRIPWESVEPGLPARNEEEEEPATLAEYPEFRAVIESFDETDRRVYELWRDCEQATAVFAVAIGVTDRPPDEQAAEVKRAKDRIIARLKRAAR
jgi:hypothetical protein